MPGPELDSKYSASSPPKFELTQHSPKKAETKMIVFTSDSTQRQTTASPLVVRSPTPNFGPVLYLFLSFDSYLMVQRRPSTTLVCPESFLGIRIGQLGVQGRLSNMETLQSFLVEATADNLLWCVTSYQIIESDESLCEEVVIHQIYERYFEKKKIQKGRCGARTHLSLGLWWPRKRLLD